MSSSHILEKYWFRGCEGESMGTWEETQDSFPSNTFITTRRAKNYFFFWVGKGECCQAPQNKFLKFPWRSVGGKLVYDSYQKIYVKSLINTFNPILRWERLEAQRAKTTNTGWTPTKWNSNDISGYYHYLYVVCPTEQPCEVSSLPFTDTESERPVVQVTCQGDSFSLWSSWDSHTDLFNSKIHVFRFFVFYYIR